jgi:hypothetical protein
MRRVHLTYILLIAAGCSGESLPPALQGIKSLVYIQRGPAEPGNVFDYAAGGTGANIFTLTPPTASGVKVNLTNWTGADINSVDLSFDARELVFSARAPNDMNYHVYRINVDGTNPCDAAAGKVSVGACQITMSANDESYPIYLPGDKILYVTNKSVETGQPQFRDEYERAETAQVSTINKDGTGEVLGPRNVSHRVAPTLLSDGRILLTEWRHLGDVNEGDLVIMNQDMTGVREGFGREGKGLTNAYLRAHEVSPGMIATIGTSRDRTFQAGKILLVNLGGNDVTLQSEARSSATDLTPDVPGDRTPSFNGVGRYYDVRPLGDTAGTQFLVTWSDGPVETEVLSMAQATPQFGIYLYDSANKTRFPIVNDPGLWDVSPIAVKPRNEPPPLKPAFAAMGTQSTLVSAINVYDSTMFPQIAPGTAKKVRITEGFSSEEGFPNMFGLTEFDGQARLGEVDVQPDGSFKAVIPANTPVRMQLIDKYGLAIKTDNSPGGANASEPLWIQGRAGEARVCGGCHEDRTKTIALAPGSSALQALGAAALDYPGVARPQRKSTTYTAAALMGVPWDKALQPIFDTHCTDCHDGSNNGANPAYTIMDVTDMLTFSFTFDLTSKPVSVNTGDMMYTFSASHVSLMGPSMLFREKQIMVTMGMPKAYVEPGNAYASTVIQMLNPPARYPAIDLNDHAFGMAPQHPAEVTQVINNHVGSDPKYQLSTDEIFLLSVMADNGGQYYSRENNPGGY